MQDVLVRSLARESGVRVFVVNATDSAREAVRRHKTAPTATAALARAITGGALIGSLLKIQHRAALRFEGTGPLEKMIVEADSYGRVRGYVHNPKVELPLVQGRQDVPKAIGQAGLLTVVKDMRLKELVESTVRLDKSDIVGDLTFYLTQSEQIPSFIDIDVILDDEGNVVMAGGVLVQALPPYEEGIVDMLSERLQELPSVAHLLRSGKTPAGILSLIYQQIPFDILEERKVRFECTCSRVRSEKALMLLGRNGLQNLLDTEGEAVIDCHFCHEEYVFDADDLDILLLEMD